MSPTFLPAVIGIPPGLVLATPLAALGPIVLAATGFVVLLLALHITRPRGSTSADRPPNEPPIREAA